MAVKAAIALADLSAVEPINGSTGGTRSRSWDLHRRETTQKKRRETQDKRAGEGWESQAGQGTQHRAESTQISDLWSHLGVSLRWHAYQNTASLSERGITQKLKHRVCNLKHSIWNLVHIDLMSCADLLPFTSF